MWQKLGKTPPKPGDDNTAGAAFATNRPPHVRIQATSNTGEEITLVPDTGSPANLISEHNCISLGLELEELESGEGHLFDIQGQLLPVIGKARMSCTLKSRNIRADVTMLVLRVPSLTHVIIGWKSLYEWGIFSIQPQAIPARVQVWPISQLSAEKTSQWETLSTNMREQGNRNRGVTKV